MATSLLTSQIVAYSLVLWLGLYLFSRNLLSPRLSWAGLGLIIFALSLAGDILKAYSLNPALSMNLARLHALLLFFSLLLWLIALIYLWRKASKRFPPLLGAGTIFFALSSGFLIFPFNGLSPTGILLVLSLNLMGLGLMVALLDARETGEALIFDILRAFDYSAVMALLFGGLVVGAIIGGAGLTLPMLALLLAVIATAIATQVFADPVQTALDRIAFAYFPRIRQARADLRAVASALPRVNPTFDLGALDEAEFVRLTRRALSHTGDLPRLATNPLTYLPLIETRLVTRGAQSNTLERAVELKSLLFESIARLKPHDQGDFGTSEAWRHYNALYFPYVIGLKPYSRRGDYHNGLDPAAHQALEWFQSQVPERTLHNWQNAAARLIAQDLRERLKQAADSKAAG